uniref:Uncharacterized protein n=1 Tax=Ditylenchus dipsaci TaxID=166011 RepID=A0A915DHC4_9BILA
MGIDSTQRVRSSNLSVLDMKLQEVFERMEELVSSIRISDNDKIRRLNTLREAGIDALKIELDEARRRCDMSQSGEHGEDDDEAKQAFPEFETVAECLDAIVDLVADSNKSLIDKVSRAAVISLDSIAALEFDKRRRYVGVIDESTDL